ncbi:MAG: hypothetical protein AB1631_21015 [Acidobacteriota bacterium]
MKQITIPTSVCSFILIFLLIGCSVPSSTTDQNSNKPPGPSNSNTRSLETRDDPKAEARPMLSSYEDSLNDLALDKEYRSLVVLPSKPVNFIDLSKVQLDKTQDTLLITYTMRDDFKNLKEATLIRFELTIWTTDDRSRYDIQTDYFRESWNSLLIGSKRGSTRKEFLPGTVISDRQIIVKCSLQLLDELTPQFTWSATARYYGKSILKGGVPYEEAVKDAIPNEGRVTFPGS